MQGLSGQGLGIKARQRSVTAKAAGVSMLDTATGRASAAHNKDTTRLKAKLKPTRTR